MAEEEEVGMEVVCVCVLQAGAGVPFRQSILEDAKVREGVKMPAEWLDAVVGSGKVSKLALLMHMRM